MDPGRHERFVELFIRNQHRVYRYILSLVPVHADAEEIFQQTSLTLWSIWELFDPSRDFVRWSCGIAHIHIRNYLRKRPNRHLLLSEDVLDQLAELRLNHESALDVRRHALTGCLEKLPPSDRSLVERCYGGDETIRNTADEMGVTPNVLYKSLRRIRGWLYECVTRMIAREDGA